MTTAVDLVRRIFGPGTTELNRLWCSDISYVRTWEGWLYLAIVIDVASRRVEGWAMGDHMRASLVCDALSMALAHRRPSPELILHSDSEYVEAVLAGLPHSRGCDGPRCSVSGAPRAS